MSFLYTSYADGGVIRLGKMDMGKGMEQMAQTELQKTEETIKDEMKRLESRFVGGWNNTETMKRYLELKRKLEELK
jgi:hypothetical protein